MKREDLDEEMKNSCDAQGLEYISPFKCDPPHLHQALLDYPEQTGQMSLLGRVISELTTKGESLNYL